MTSSGSVSLYILRNTVNDKFYIGVTSRPVRLRWLEHARQARYRSHKGRLYYAIRKYGEDAFTVSVIETAPDIAAGKLREIALIAEMKPHYNSTRGGDGTVGHRITAAGRRRMSEAHIGNKYNLGRRWPKDRREKMSATKKGCAAPPRSALMDATRAENMRKAALAARRKVVCLTDGRVFESAREASEHYGFDKTSVASVCSRQRGRQAVYGLRFEYVT